MSSGPIELKLFPDLTHRKWDNKCAALSLKGYGNLLPSNRKVRHLMKHFGNTASFKSFRDFNNWPSLQKL